MRQKLPLTIAAVLTVLFGGIVVLLLVNNAHENASKQLLADELTRLPVANGCHEQSRSYQRGGVDTVSSWEVHYQCTSTATAAYGDILSGLRNLGFSMTWGSSGSFRSSNGQFQVDYSFLPKPSIAGATDNIDNTPASITTHIYRQGHSY